LTSSCELPQLTKHTESAALLSAVPANCSHAPVSRTLFVFWSKAAKALSTTPSKGVTFAG